MLETLPVIFRRFRLKTQLNNLIYSALPENLLKSDRIKTFLTPCRTTMVVKRIFPVQLYKEGNKPKLRARNFYYELEENTDIKKDPVIDLVLTSFVQGIGNPGDIVSMKRFAAYEQLLLPGLATYLTEESLEYSKNIKKDEKLQETLYTPSEDRTVNFLKKTTVNIVMNKDVEWTIQPWHIRASFRKAGIHILSDDSIELPLKPIKGPNLDLENKIFYVTITINKKHKVKVLCRIHHWTAIVSERLPFKQEYWLEDAGKIFPEDEEAKVDNNTKISDT